MRLFEFLRRKKPGKPRLGEAPQNPPVPTSVANRRADSSTVTNSSGTRNPPVPTAQPQNLAARVPERANQESTVPTVLESSVPTPVDEERPNTTSVSTVPTREFERQVKGLHQHLENIKKELLTPILARIDSHDEKVLEQFQQLPSEIRKDSTKLFQELKQLLPGVPPKTRDFLMSIGNLGESHKKIVNLFLNSEIPEGVLSYDEIGQNLGLSSVTVRGYVADLRRLGFPFIEKRSGRKVLIGVKEASLRSILEHRNPKS